MTTLDTVPYGERAVERSLYEAVTDYVRHGYRRARAERRLLLRAPADASRPRRDPVGARVPRDAAVGRRRARPGAALPGDLCRAGRPRAVARPARQARRGRLPRRVRTRAGRDVRRTVPATAGARRRAHDAIAPALLPAGRQPVRVRRECRRARRRARGQRIRVARPARPWSGDAPQTPRPPWYRRVPGTPATRGEGIGGAVLESLEAEARKLGIQRLVLETGTRQDAALRLYRRSGFREVELFGEYLESPTTSICMSKDLR